MKKPTNTFLRQDEPMLHQDHPFPRTRREFLAQGFFSMGSAYVTAPTLLSMLVAKQAYGVDCTGPDIS